MKVLALEFSSSQRSVAVVSKLRRNELHESPSGREAGWSGARVTRPPEMMVTEIIESTCGNTTKPLGMVEEALKLAGVEREQLECVAIGLGPGSYTGVRVAIALAQGWQLARGVKLLGISSAECIASQAQLNGLTGICSVVIDARRDEFYLATYEITATELREVKPLKLVPMEKVLECQKAGGVFIGPEVTRWFAEGRVVFPRAATLGGLALERKDFVKGEQLEPIYLRETNFVKAPPPRIVS